MHSVLSPPAAETQAGSDYINALPYYKSSSDSEAGVEALAEDDNTLMADVEQALAPPEVSWL